MILMKTHLLIVIISGSLSKLLEVTSASASKSPPGSWCTFPFRLVGL